jgi:uncharacterized protein
MRKIAAVLLIGVILTAGVAAQGTEWRWDGTNRMHEMIIAAESGDIQALEMFLEAGEYVDVRDPLFMMMTPLMAAAESGNPKTVTFLLEKGANVNESDILGRSAVMYAAMCGSCESIRRLVQAGADIARVSKLGWGAVDYAAGSGSEEATELIASLSLR